VRVLSCAAFFLAAATIFSAASKVQIVCHSSSRVGKWSDILPLLVAEIKKPVQVAGK